MTTARQGRKTENGNGNSVGATKNADGNLFNLAVNANATGAGENKNASGEGDLFSMFGNTEPAAPAEK
jgi:hypothetical protein